MGSLLSDLRENFDFTNGVNIIRVMAGAFYAPHIIYKMVGFDGSLAFFAKAGLEPAGLFLVLALITETVCCLGLFFGILTRWVGVLSAGAMTVAAYATIATKGIGWYWNKGGVEYLVFWGVTSLALALIAWRRHWADHPQSRKLINAVLARS